MHYVSLNGYFYRSIYLVYLLACTKYMGPKVVLTFIDNSPYFQWLSRNYLEAQFYAIQNGVRNSYNVHECLPEPPDPFSKVSMPNLICFGQYEKDLFQQYGHQIDSFHPVGALRGACFKYELWPECKNKEILYDVCIVSQWFPELFAFGLHKEYGESWPRILCYVKQYMQEYNIKICIAGRFNAPLFLAEKQWYKNFLGDSICFIKYNGQSMSTYFAMQQSEVVISLNSTAAVEAFGLEKKVLFCNFSRRDRVAFPYDGVWSIHGYNRTYEEFRSKLNYLRKLDGSSYLQMNAAARKYVMNYREDNLPQKYIRHIVEQCIGKE